MRPQVERYLHELVSVVEGVLADQVVGVYAAGSVALGAFEPTRSDIDVAVVTRRSLGAGAKTRLVEQLRHEALPCPARGLELVVYRHEVTTSTRRDPAFELELNSGSGMEQRVSLRPEDRPAGDGRFWYGLDRDILHAHGLAFAGPPAGDVFVGLTADGVRGLLLDSLVWWHDRTPDDGGPTPGADDAVLGACRALVRHRDGRWLAKVPAAQRLLTAEGGLSELVRQCVEARAGGPPPPGRDARAFLEHVRQQIGESST